MSRTILFLALTFIALFVVSLQVGRMLFPIWSAVSSPVYRTIVVDVRLPRILAASLAGASLALAGAVFQNVFRNYLAGPGILGTTSGAAFGAAVAILLAPLTTVTVQLSSFSLGLAATMLSCSLARLVGESTLALVLSGMVVSALFSAGLGVIKYVADPYNKLPAIVYWLLGSFSGVRWCDLASSAPLMVLSALLIVSARWVLNVLSLSDEEAQSLGLSVRRWRMFFVALATLGTSASVSIAGMIAWIGVLSPHIARLVAGHDARSLVPSTALVGALLLLACDDIARSVSPAEIPISIVTHVVGAPTLFAILMRRRMYLAKD